MTKFGGYAGSVLRVDLSKNKIKKVPLNKEVCQLYIGGRGMDAKLLFDELAPETQPLSIDNILCLSTGPLTGLLGPTTGRVNVTTKSPLTGIYGNSNAGTNWGPELKYAGYDRIVIKGRADRPVYINIEDNVVEVRDAKHIWGKGVFETTRIIQEDCHGYETRVASCGPAAERGILFGSVIFDFWDAAGRTGTGTVMASKNLKAISVTGTGELSVADPQRYLEIVRDGWNGLLEDPGFRTGEHSALGTSICVNWGNAQGWLPTRNFRDSHFEGAERISGEEFRDHFSTRGSPIPGGRACLSCPNRCKRFGRVETGKYAGTKGNIEFEGVAAFGSKCGVKELDAVFHAYMLANDYGMDCITCGNTIALFMELHEEGILSHEETDGLELHFGNADAMVEMVHKIANRKGKLGELGVAGSLSAARNIGRGAEQYANCVKGLETIACDPRTAKGFGFTYAIASRGSDHLRSHPVFEMLRYPPELGEEMFGSKKAVELRKYDGKVKMVVWHENLGAVTDSLGTCRFMHASYYAQYPIPELLAKYSKTERKVNSIKYHDWLSAATGMNMTYEQLLETGNRIINLERALNVRFGVRRKDDTLPERFLKERIPSGPAKGERFDRRKLDSMIDEYYLLRGWDRRTGLPIKEKLVDLKMKDVADDLKKRGLVVSRRRTAGKRKK